MRRIIAFRIASLIVIFTICNNGSYGQTLPDSVKYINDLFRVEKAYSDTTYLKFKITYYYEEWDTHGPTRDTLTGVYQLHGDKMYFNMDSVLMIQNEQFRIVVYNLDSMMEVSTPKQLYTKIFQSDLYDTLFRQLNIQNVVLTDTGASRKLSFKFHPYSPYVSYDLIYDTTNYRLTHVMYMIKKGIVETGPGVIPSQYVSIKIVFSNYDTAAFSDSIYGSSQFFTRQNGVFVVVSPYNGFELINTTVED